MQRIAIADDLTGANNVGVLLTRQGFSTLVVSHDSPILPSACDALCVDTDSRYLSPALAAQRVQAVVERGLAQGVRLFCNRVDNLLRGNIGAATGAILRALGPEALAVVAPAFPALGRNVVAGHLLVDGIPVHGHPIAANDPISPVRHSRIADILAEQCDAPASSIGLAEVESAGIGALAQHLERDAALGTRVVVVDGRTDAHLQRIAQAMAMLQRPCVPVDPGPLSALYLRSVREQVQDAGGTAVLVVVGSVTPLSHQQLGYFAAQAGIEPVRIDAAALSAPGPERRAAIDGAAGECLRLLERGSPFIALTTHRSDGRLVELEPLAHAQGHSPCALAKTISDGLAEAAFLVLSQSRGLIGGCFSSGGDVTASLFKASGAGAIKILGDVVPLTAHVELIGGQLHGLQMVTKGGSIGSESTLAGCVQYLAAQLQRR